jgi:hypothetical protein
MANKNKPTWLVVIHQDMDSGQRTGHRTLGVSATDILDAIEQCIPQLTWDHEEESYENIISVIEIRP